VKKVRLGLERRYLFLDMPFLGKGQVPDIKERGR
jgi:hypothetical protein